MNITFLSSKCDIDININIVLMNNSVFRYGNHKKDSY